MGETNPKNSPPQCSKKLTVFIG